MDMNFELENGIMDTSDFELRDYSHESFASPSSEGNRLPRMRTANKGCGGTQEDGSRNILDRKHASALDEVPSHSVRHRRPQDAAEP